ncbi:TR10B factor, partial [Urocolius indicus]|nr:TR10B factor [Urocolius indicus]
CQPCKDEEFIEYPNDFPKCLDCTTCREDQVELSPCKATRDRQCICRNGTFCSPDHPCEMCQKCRPRCPQDEVEQAPCTPYSDRRCGPPTSTPGAAKGLLLGSGLHSVLVAVSCQSPLQFHAGAEQSALLSSGQDPRGSSGPARDLLSLRSQETLGCPGDVSSPPVPTAPKERERMSGLGTAFVPGLGGCYRTLSFQGVVSTTSSPSEKPRKKLVPVEGKDPITILRRSFDTFAQDVPCKDWKRFGRALDLLENDIALAEMNDRYSLEPFFQMLNTWQNTQGMKASVNTLLEALHRINLGGIAEDISSKLVQQGSFQYEVS